MALEIGGIVAHARKQAMHTQTDLGHPNHNTYWHRDGQPHKKEGEKRKGEEREERSGTGKGAGRSGGRGHLEVFAMAMGGAQCNMGECRVELRKRAFSRKGLLRELNPGPLTP